MSHSSKRYVTEVSAVAAFYLLEILVAARSVENYQMCLQCLHQSLQAILGYVRLVRDSLFLAGYGVFWQCWAVCADMAVQRDLDLSEWVTFVSHCCKTLLLFFSFQLGRIFSSLSSFVTRTSAWYFRHCMQVVSGFEALMLYNTDRDVLTEHQKGHALWLKNRSHQRETGEFFCLSIRASAVPKSDLWVDIKFSSSFWHNLYTQSL